MVNKTELLEPMTFWPLGGGLDRPGLGVWILSTSEARLVEIPMGWKKLLAYISCSVDEELLLRIQYLATENRILRSRIKGRLSLTDGDGT